MAKRKPYNWAIGYLNPYYNLAVFVKSVDKTSGSMSLTSVHDEGLADALLMPEEVARGILNQKEPMLPSPAFIIEVPLDRVKEFTPKRRQGTVVTH